MLGRVEKISMRCVLSVCRCSFPDFWISEISVGCILDVEGAEGSLTPEQTGWRVDRVGKISMKGACSLHPRGSTWVLLKLRIAGFSLTSDWSEEKEASD